MSELTMDSLVIQTDDDAWKALTKALANEIGDTVNVIFEGWPVFKITLEGEDFHSTMPTRIMPPILELQKEIHRIYCRAKYNDESTRKLTDEDRKALELVVEVKAGSSEYITKIGKALNEIIKNSNMTGPQVVVMLVTISGIIAGEFAWKDWVQFREREHQMDLSVRMSEEETKRLELVTKAMQRDPEIQKTRDAIDELRSDLAKKLQPGDKLKINAQPIVTGSRAAQITSTPRISSEETRVDGEFVINEVKFPKMYGEAYRFNVTRLIDNKTLTVNVSPSKITDQQLAILKDGGFGIRKVIMEINAKDSRGNLSNANLVSIKWPE